MNPVTIRLLITADQKANAKSRRRRVAYQAAGLEDSNR